MPLKGIKVIELAGIIPAPICGMILADFGATVIRVDRLNSNPSNDSLSNGKQALSLNIKHPEGAEILQKLSTTADVFIDPFRPGVLESLNLGPDNLTKQNPRLVYARLTGFGKKGFYSKIPGHDINYLALTGLLPLFKRTGENPMYPSNIASDVGGGGFMCALGIILALFERSKSNKGQVLENSIVEGTTYLGSWQYRRKHTILWDNKQKQNQLINSTHFYDIYKTKDDKFLSVAPIEPKYYAELLEGLGLTQEEAPQYENIEQLRKLFATKFLEKTQEEWTEIFEKKTACVVPVLDLNEAPAHPHNIANNIFTESPNFDKMVPNPAPKLNRTPGSTKSIYPFPKPGEHTYDILRDLGYSNDQVIDLESRNVIETCKSCNKL